MSRSCALPLPPPLTAHAAPQPAATALRTARRPLPGMLLGALLTLLACGSLAAQAPPTGQSTYGFARARELAALGRLPRQADVVVRDIVNYHRHRVPVPGPDAAVGLEVRADRAGVTPGETFWLQVGYATAPEGDRALAEPVALALVVDCGASMADGGELVRARAGLAALVGRLRPDDRVALVAFADEARLVQPLRARGDGRALQAAIAALASADPGTTPGTDPGADLRADLLAGLSLGIAQLHDEEARSRRVVLLTDGGPGRAEADAAALARSVAERCGDRVDLATIGVGDDLDAALLRRLSAATGGPLHFVAADDDIDRVFVREADSLLTPVARDVRLSLTLPTTQTVLVPGHEFTTRDDLYVELRLPDLDAGATGVVMVRGRLPESFRGVEGPVRVPVSLRYRRAVDGEPRRLRGTASLSIRSGDAADRPDLLVRKNAAIAVLADGLHTMAAACDRQCWSEANRALATANDAARALFPGEDPDLQRVRDLVAGHARTLRRYVDRFRRR